MPLHYHGSEEAFFLMVMTKLRLTLFVFLASVFSSFAQDLSQSISGRIRESITRSPIAQANLSLYRGDELIKGAVSDSVGYFFIKDIEPGRYKLIASFTGYASFENELLIVSGKAQRIEIFLQESQRVLDEVVVSPQAVSMSNVTSISIEKTLRVPANFFDPVRMLTSYPGVVATNDQANSIVVKGYSPNGILWRLQGLDIINPNHLANAGTLSDKPVTSGGGVNVLSAQLLDRTDFYSGAMPVQYGNALSGAMDLTLRPGNADKMQYTAQASLIGLDLAAEGPLSKAKKSSFLANYRYSTVGLLSNMGVDFGGEKINFQDFSFHLNVPGKKGGNLSAFGFGGISANDFNAKPESEWEEEKDRYTINYNGKVYGIGVLKQFKPGWMSVSMGASFSGQDQERKSQSAAFSDPHISGEYYFSQRALASGFIKGIRKISKQGFVEAGIRTNYIDHELDVSTVMQSVSNYNTPNYSGTVSGLLWQPYVALSQSLGQFNFGAGVRYVNFSYNGTSSVEPRASLARNWSNNVVTLSYSLASQVQQSFIYLMDGNKSLGLTKSNQLSLEWKMKLQKDLRFTSSVYYHQLFNVPILANFYSVINQWDEYQKGTYANDGKGRNYGVEAQVEKRFYGDLYFMVAGSVYKSEYDNGTKYVAARFNGKFTSSLLGGKEWRKTNKSFGVHARVLYSGGLGQPVIDEFMSSVVGTSVFNYSLGYDTPLPNYFRTDLRVSWRKNKPGYTRTLSIDIQNLTAQQNVSFQYYDTFKKAINTKYQVGIIPVLAYRIDF